MFNLSLGYAAFTKAERRLKECLIFNLQSYGKDEKRKSDVAHEQL